MPSYLNNLNLPVKISSGQISNTDNQDGLLLLSKRNSEDLNNIADYINSVLVSSVSSLCSKPEFPHDTLESGISGLTIVTYPESEGNNSFNNELFWKPGATPEEGRPCTIKESFDYLLSSMIDRVIEVRDSIVDLNPIWEQIRCHDRKLSQIKEDAFGEKYVLTCNSETSLNYSLSRHIKEIITQLTNNPSGVIGGLEIGDSNYPQLALNLGTSVFATETSSGIVEIATLQEVMNSSNIVSESGAELAVTPSKLTAALDVSNDINNALRKKVKTISDERIAAANLSDLNNVDENNPSDGNVLVYSNGMWTSGSADESLLLGSDTVQPTINDVAGLVISNYDMVAYSKKEATNIKIQSHAISGLNPNYLFTQDNQWKVSDSSTLRQKKVPFVFRSAPTDVIYNTSLLDIYNSTWSTETGVENYRGKIFNTGLYGGNQARCTFYNDATNTHLIKPKKLLGICRSDLSFADSLTMENGNAVGSSVSSEFNTHMQAGSTILIQEDGVSRVMVLGPYKLGDSLYICPDRILEMMGIPNGLGICIAESFLDDSISSMTIGAVNIPSDMFTILLREPTITHLTTLNKLEVESKQLGLVINKNNLNYDYNTLSNNTINNLCYNLLDLSFAPNLASTFNSYIEDEFQEILGNTNFLNETEYTKLLLKFSELSLPVVKLTL